MAKETKKKQTAYGKSGVDIDAAEEAVDLMKEHVQSTYDSNVLSHIGTFGGLLDVTILKKYKQPVLVLSIDGAGTKTMIAKEMNQWTIGQCIVNHCVNDILAQGAQALAFLNYVAASQLKPEMMAKIVENMAIACKAIGIPIIGGETAEMPGVYQKGQHDIVGSIIGIVEKSQIIDGSKIAEGDVLIGLLSNGLHTNGYSLTRKAFFETLGLNVNSSLTICGVESWTIGEELLRIHKCYFKSVYPLLGISSIEIHGIAHITGGGFFENIGRLLPKGLRAVISHKWKIPPVFKYIQGIEKVSDEEMQRVFNLGIGMVLIVPLRHVKKVRDLLREHEEPNNIVIGTIEKTRCRKKNKKVVFIY